MSEAILIFNLLLLLSLVWVIYKQAFLESIRPYVLLALAFKLVCGILLGLLYHHYYQEGDTLTFKNASIALTEYAFQNPKGYIRLLLFNEFSSEELRASLPFTRFPGFSNSFFFLKILSLLNLLTGSSYYLNSLYLSLFSFWGTSKLVSVLVQYRPEFKLAAVLAFLFFPSVVFWSSGVLKDPLIFGSMCWVSAIALRYKQTGRFSSIVWLPLALFIRLKFFLALLLLPLLIVYVVVSKFKVSTSRKVVYMLLSVGILSMVGAWLVYQYNDAFFYRNLVYTYNGMLELSEGQPHVRFNNLEPNLGSMLINAPEAVIAAVFRPFVWEAWSPLITLMGLENLLLLLLVVLAMLSFIKQGKLPIPSTTQLLFLLITVSFAMIIGLTTPNFGTLSRYRIAFLPFLVYLLLQAPLTHKLVKRFRI